MTLGSMVTYIVERLGKRTDIESSVYSWIYWAAIEIAKRHNFQEYRGIKNETIAASTATVTLITNIKSLYWVACADYDSGTYSNVKRIKPIDLTSLDNATFFPESSEFTGVEDRYYLNGTTLRLISSYSAEKALRYSYALWPTELTNDTLSYSFNSDKDRLHIAGTLAIAYQALQMPELATYWYNSFDAQLEVAIEQDEEKKDLRGVLGGSGTPEMTFGEPAIMPMVRS